MEEEEAKWPQRTNDLGEVGRPGLCSPLDLRFWMCLGLSKAVAPCAERWGGMFLERTEEVMPRPGQLSSKGPTP